MQKLLVFNSVSIDGYFASTDNDLTWSHNPVKDPEWVAYVSGNASAGGTLLFGRITYELMASFWPTTEAAASFPVIAEGMNRMKKIVVSKTFDSLAWENSELMKGELIPNVKSLKEQSGNGIAILGSGKITAQLAEAGLIDEYQLVVNPIVLGSGRTMFEGLSSKLPLRLTSTRKFENGNVLLCFELPK
jgi:dihydrofolate reductase